MHLLSINMKNVAKVCKEIFKFQFGLADGGGGRHQQWSVKQIVCPCFIFAPTSSIESDIVVSVCVCITENSIFIKYNLETTADTSQ